MYTSIQVSLQSLNSQNFLKKICKIFEEKFENQFYIRYSNFIIFIVGNIKFKYVLLQKSIVNLKNLNILSPKVTNILELCLRISANLKLKVYTEEINNCLFFLGLYGRVRILIKIIIYVINFHTK
jgi:hypothetical protein